jgi:hypothetical protein
MVNQTDCLGISKEDDTRLWKISIYPFDKFLSKVCDAEFDGYLSQKEATNIVKKFKRLKTKGIRLKKKQLQIDKFIQDVLRM